MDSHGQQSTPQSDNHPLRSQVAAPGAPGAPKKTQTLNEYVLEIISKTAAEAGADLSKMGIPVARIEFAAKAVATKKSRKIIGEAMTYARKRAKSETVSPSEIIIELGGQLGIKLTPRKPTKRIPKTEKGSPSDG